MNARDPTPRPDHGQHPAFMAFEAWASATAANARPLSESSKAKYRSLWNAYCAWLAARDLPWDQVTPSDLTTFLDGPAPSTSSRRLPLDDKHMARATRNRYWRLINGVYAQARVEETIEANPCADLSAPTLGNTDRQPQVLPPRALDHLRDPERVRALLPQDSADHWWVLRDRALISLLAHTGLATSELTALTGAAIRCGPQPIVGTRELLPSHSAATTAQSGPDLLGGKTTPYELDVPLSREYVARTLPLSPAVMTHLGPWLACRQRLLAERSAYQDTLTSREAYMRAHAVNGPLFLSRKAGGPHKDLPPMAASSIYVSVRNAFAALYATSSIASPDAVVTPERGVHVAAGAAIVRNTVLKHWCETLGREATMKLAGLKTGDTLRFFPDAAAQTPHKSNNQATA